MVDIEPTIISDFLDLSNISSESRIVIVIDPDTLSGGTILYDKNIPSGKTLNGNISISGKLS